ncbi:MAG TPA: hypothetical protein VFW79_02970 [Cellulomonas sp.]|uniref:DUF6912 family protein n=1 Tax=Cellulomonas sp. TaxID=40001 RepID=UPI002E325912|nr:hypothetical protein [Cellulomonas sp.]HEX5331580.1 hypothetical protein [Cellulomonas sp.]
MRIYLPSTLDELDATAKGAEVSSDGPGSAVASFEPRIVHAVTPALRAALPDEDEEGLEFVALLAAADEALLRIAARPDAPRLRLVLSLDVSEADLAAMDDDDQAPSAIRLRVAVGRDDLVCAHVDEPAASADVERALAGDAGAAERLDDLDLLWYDATELAAIPR